MTTTVTGGCQCGAVRYALTGKLKNPHICHCRMCQKAFGSFFAPLVAVARTDFKLTRGEPAKFRSSHNTDRGFCRDCGTPLSFEYLTADHIAVSIGSLDLPDAAVPARQYGVESRVSYFAELAELPGTVTEAGNTDRAAAIKASNRQHPDHDTSVWPTKH